MNAPAWPPGFDPVAAVSDLLRCLVAFVLPHRLAAIRADRGEFLSRMAQQEVTVEGEGGCDLRFCRSGAGSEPATSGFKLNANGVALRFRYIPPHS